MGSSGFSGGGSAASVKEATAAVATMVAKKVAEAVQLRRS
jgi:hypothetical protein